MIHMNEALIVEGRYDKSKLSALTDAIIVTTNGFGIYKDAEKRDFIRKLAKERGIKVSERKDRASEDFANLITVDVVAGGQKLSVQGTLFGTQGRIVRINDFRVDVDPHARILICPHINRPGVIGTVGTLLGGNGVNISAMQVGTTEEEGKNLMVLTVDNDIPAALLETVKALDGIFDAKLVNFYEI